MDGFTKKAVSEITGLSLRSIQYYTERDLVKPEVDPGEGRGQVRLYSRKNLIEFGLIKALSRYSMSFAELKKLMVLFIGSILLVKEDLVEKYADPDSWNHICDHGFLVAYVAESGGATVGTAYLDLDAELPVTEETRKRIKGIPSSFIRFSKVFLEVSESMLVIRLKNIIRKAESA